MNKQNVDHPSHPMLHIIPCSKDNYHIYLNSGIDFNGELYDKLENLFKDGFGSKSEPLKYNRQKLNSLITDMNKIIQSYDPEDEPEDSSGSSDDDDDKDNIETIQKVLARRLKSTSSQKTIEEYHISDSEEEDMIKHSRRLRFLLKEVKQMKDEITNLKH
jgi:hypothetical protein